MDLNMNGRGLILIAQGVWGGERLQWQGRLCRRLTAERRQKMSNQPDDQRASRSSIHVATGKSVFLIPPPRNGTLTVRSQAIYQHQKNSLKQL